MRLKILSCENVEKNYKIAFEYIEGDFFYPDGKGGQIGDLGQIGDANIVKVLENNIIIDKFLENNREYFYSIDSQRRMDAQENHTGEHIFSALAFLKYGWKTNSFRMAENYCTIDFNVTEVTDEIVDELEKEVNLKIQEGIDITEEICDYERASFLLGDRKSIPEKAKDNIRILSTFSGDYNACAGLHTKNTKDVKIFKILYYEKVKSTFTRFYFVSGNKAVVDYNKKHKIISNLGVKLSCQPDDIIPMFDKVIEEKRKIEKEKKDLELKYSQIVFKDLINNPAFSFNSENNNIKVFHIKETKEINDTLKKLFQNLDYNYLLVLYSNNTYSISSNNFDCLLILNILKEQFKIKGGGNSKNINFNLCDLDSHIVSFLKNYLI